MERYICGQCGTYCEVYEHQDTQRLEFWGAPCTLVQWVLESQCCHCDSVYTEEEWLAIGEELPTER